MFGNTKAFSGFAVKDIAQAKSFYTDTLGLSVSEGMYGILKLHLPTGAEIIVYPKLNHVPATFTLLNFPVDNVEETVRQLNEKGILMEHYDYEHFKTDEKGIFRDGGPLIAWFKDPSGNILSVIETNN